MFANGAPTVSVTRPLTVPPGASVKLIPVAFGAASVTTTGVYAPQSAVSCQYSST